MSKDGENRYHQSKLYKLVDQVEGYYYIGSSACKVLSKRLMWHKQDSSKPKFQKQKKYEHFNKIGWNNIKIILISEHKFENKMELLREEDKLIKQYRTDLKCLNVCRSFMTDEDKKTYIHDHNKKYREEHYEELLVYEKERNKIRYKIKTKCECGVSYINTQIKKHLKCKQHIDFFKYKNNEIDNSQYVLCECGSVIKNNSLERHTLSKWHILHLQ